MSSAFAERFGDGMNEDGDGHGANEDDSRFFIPSKPILNSHSRDTKNGANNANAVTNGATKTATIESKISKIDFSFALHPLMIALYTGVVVFIILCIFQPIFVTSENVTKSQTGMTVAQRTMLAKRRKLNLLKVLLWSLISFGTVAAIPYIVAWIEKAKVL